MGHAKGMKNSHHIPNALLKAGKPDYIGVCPNEVSFRLREMAVNWIGRTEYALINNVTTQEGLTFWNANTKNKWKCNIFLTHLANRVGATTPYYYEYWGRMPRAPVAADDWHLNPEKHIDLDGPGWHFLGVAQEPSPGMSVASHSYPPGSGHCGVLDYDGTWINASKDNVNKSVHLSDDGMLYKSPHFRTR
jgi:hypothetical protein